MIVDSPYEQVRPTFISFPKIRAVYVLLKINPKISTSEALAKIEHGI